ncbi:purple acid phosphatase family protein [Filimonas effusa]|uniref:acid phosphatase n=1 Tax=Filimonas effusa TaxID=2508721 RepID=A0A4Q1D624_9BACT|nr:tartrate-resistant acid phosphatase type 5 family protein [Filimonas effusa]RXK83097.1 acid phosphatase [Filimonas effusa]
MKQLFILLAGLCSVAMLQAQAPLTDDQGYRGGSIEGLKKPAKALNFIVMGDWGRNGENYQKEVAAGMGKAAHDLDASFVVAVGDNFYPYGVASTQDHQWITSYESVYTAQSLHVKWYVVLGNHDYITNPDAQVAYTKMSSRWTMPSRYYSKTFNINGDTAQKVLMLFIDTDPIEKQLRGQAHDSIKYPAGAVETQLRWMEQELQASKATWKIVVGHHPVYTGGWRADIQDTKNMRGVLEPLFRKYGVELYISGHEHHLEYTKPAGNTHYVISGAASESRPAALNKNGGQFTAATQGFTTFSVTPEEVTVQFIDHNDKVINVSSLKHFR